MSTPEQLLSIVDESAVQRAFSKQSEHYDLDDEGNAILIDWRNQVYQHVDSFIKSASEMLELNAGTGIDAVRFVKKGHHVLATDSASGMIDRIQKKISSEGLENRLRVERCSFESLRQFEGRKFDYIFSNFGGLNCSRDLSLVTRHFPNLLNESAYVTIVIMPRVAWWEFLQLFKGKANAFRRLKKNGVMAHLEGEYFKTYYYSLSDVRNAFGEKFEFVKSEGLGVISPPPSALRFIKNYPRFYSSLKKIDQSIRNIFPFNRWGDHIIVTFKFKGK